MAAMHAHAVTPPTTTTPLSDRRAEHYYYEKQGDKKDKGKIFYGTG